MLSNPIQAAVASQPGRYNPESVRALATQLAAGAGVPDADAGLLADALVDADIHGVTSHGISRLNIYLRRIQKGLINPVASLTLDSHRRAVLAVNAGNGLGQVQTLKTLDLLTPMARENGVAVATIRNSQHFGAVSYYCNKAADHNMILLATTNCEPAMSPEGGCQAFFGTNPIAASFPTGKGFHIKIDMATSIVARGNIIAAQKSGKSIPPGWALNVDGEPTTDAGAALLGTVLTMAGHKGYALAMMVEIFSGVLSGSAIGADVGSMYKNMDRKQDVGHFLCLLDISAFMDVAEFKNRMDGMIDEIKACRMRPGVEEILIPGERSHRRAMENRRLGIPIDPPTRKELQVLCEELKVPFVLDESAAMEVVS